MAATSPSKKPRTSFSSPVRDAERREGNPYSREDLKRQPDGIPHQVVGLTALFSALLAILIAGVVVAGGRFGLVYAVVLGLIAVPVLVALLRKKAARERDVSHPSR